MVRPAGGHIISLSVIFTASNGRQALLQTPQMALSAIAFTIEQPSFEVAKPVKSMGHAQAGRYLSAGPRFYQYCRSGG